MARMLWAVLLLCPCLLCAGDAGARAQFVGGTLAGIGKSGVRIDVTGKDALVCRSSRTGLRIPYQRIHTLEYGQRVNRRYAEAVLISPLLLLSKSRKHFLTVAYTDEGGAQQALVFQVNKRDIRSVLASLEARTGRKVEYQDDEARRSGKG